MTMTTVRTSRFGAWLRGLDTFAAQLLLLERDVDACDLAAAEAALGGDEAEDEGDPDGDETDEQDEPDIPAAIAH